MGASEHTQKELGQELVLRERQLDSHRGHEQHAGHHEAHVPSSLEHWQKPHRSTQKLPRWRRPAP